MLLQVELFKFVHLFTHRFALIPLFKAHFVVLSSVSQEILLNLANILKLKLVIAELEINQCMILFQAVSELRTYICR